MIVCNLLDLKSLPLLAEGRSAVQDAFVAAVDGRATLPPVGYLSLSPRNAECHVKMGYISGGDEIFVVKIASGFYENTKKGLPSCNGLVAIFSAETGEALAIINDQGILTSIRTGLASAITTLVMSHGNTRSIGIVGTGTQARWTIRALATLSQNVLDFMVWGRSLRHAERFAVDMAQEGYTVKIIPSLKEMCSRADALVTVTAANSPLLHASWVREGTHITAVGADAPGKQELALDLVQSADLLVTDLLSQSLDHGEFSCAFRQGIIDGTSVFELGHIFSNQISGRKRVTDITIADLTGLATQDVAIGQVALHALQARGKYKL